LPSAPKTAGAERHVLRFEVSGEVLATFREALTKLRRDADGSLDDDAALLLMARHVLGGPADEGRASYQVAMTVCEACQRTTQTGRGEAVEVSADVAAMARCDAQIVPRAHVGETDRAHVGQTDAATWVKPSTPTWVMPSMPTWVKPSAPTWVNPSTPTWVNPSSLTRRLKPFHRR
jgi:hypothetical protein